MTQKHLSDTRFDSFDLPESILAALQEFGFTLCTPIQAKTLPVSLAGRDVCGQAQTGTGKTVAFLVSVFNRLLKDRAAGVNAGKQPQVLILAPTRELAVQIAAESEVFARHCGFTQAAVFGGTGYNSQKALLEDGVDLVIGTPGRIIDYFKSKVFSLKYISTMVVDEADRMFDLGFIKDIRFLLRRLPPPDKRLSMLFSATLSYRVNELAYEHMNNPDHVAIEPEQVTAAKIEEIVYYPAKEEKIPLLIGLIRSIPSGQILVFVNTKYIADKVANFLNGNDFTVALLTGDIPQKKRLALLKEFADGTRRVMVATDVAARGLHIPDVSHVINFDLPQDSEDYVHRIGRTGRAGAEGHAVSFACEDYAFHLPEIEEYIGHKIPSTAVDPDILPSQLAPPKQLVSRKEGGGRRGGGRGDRSGSRKDGGGSRDRSRRRSSSRSQRKSGPKQP